MRKSKFFLASLEARKTPPVVKMTIWQTYWITENSFVLLCCVWGKGIWEVTKKLLYSVLKQYNYQIANGSWGITSLWMASNIKPMPNGTSYDKPLCSWFTLVCVLAVVKKENLGKSKFDRESHSTKRERETAFVTPPPIQVMAFMHLCHQS